MTAFGLVPWLLVAGSAMVATWLFLLKVRPPRIAVASLVLWQRVAGQPRELSWWDRVRRAVSLVCTVLIALALASAVVRRFAVSGAGGGDRVLLVMDSSLSMQARADGGGTRWSAAVAEAKGLAATSADVILATTASGVVEGPTSDVALIDAALDSLVPSAGDVGVWPRSPDARVVHFFTDGALERPLDATVIVHSVFKEAANVAITAFGTRPSTSATTRAEAYLEVAHYGRAAQDVHITVTRGAAAVFDERLSLAPGETLRKVLPLEHDGAPRLLARVTGPDDALAIDNEAVAWIAEADAIDVTLVSDRPEVFASLLQQDPGLEVHVVSSSAYQPVKTDVFVFDRWVPPAAPGKPALFVAPPDSPWLGARKPDEMSPVLMIRQDHPVLAGVELSTLDLRRLRRYDSPGIFALAVSGRGVPVVSLRDRPDSRFVILGFSADDANLDSAPAFPVLVGNAIEWLARPRLAPPGPPGVRRLPSSTTRVTSPSGDAVSLVRAGDAMLADLTAPGLYLAELGGARSVVSVGVNSPLLSDLMATHIPRDASRSTWRRSISDRPWSLYLTAMAFALLVVEWWTWQRRVTV